MRHVLLACALTAASFAAQAEDSPFSYTYADLRYVSADADAVSADGDGYQVKGSFGYLGFAYALGSVRYFKSEDFSTGGTTTGSLQLLDVTAGFGVHHAITPTLDAFGSAAYLRQEQNGKGGASAIDNFFDEGYSIEAGLLMALAPTVEVTGSFDHRRIFEQDLFLFTLEGEYKFTPNFSAVASTEHGSEADGYSFGARYNF